MDNPVVIILVTASLAALLTFVLIKALDKLRLTDAENKAKEIVSRAEREIDNRRKEAELSIKEEALKAKAAGESDLHKLRQELHERDRLLDLSAQLERPRRDVDMRYLARVEDGPLLREVLAGREAGRVEPRRAHLVLCFRSEERHRFLH